MVVGTHGSTFGGNPLAMAVGNGVMDLLLEPGLLEEVTAKGAYLQQALAALVLKYPQQLGSVQGLGLMIGLVCKMPNTELMTRLRDNKLLVVTAGNNMIRLLPPLNISSHHLDQGLATIESVLQQIQAEAN